MTNIQTTYTTLLLTLLVLCDIVEGHGRLLEPPSRSSMWRQGYSNLINYNDNELNCGGANYQHAVSGSKCGTCGDPYGRNIKDNEAGGKYANDIVVRTYQQGQTIPVGVQITAQHGGWFEIRICPIKVSAKGKGEKVNPKCLDANVLEHSDGSGNRTFMKAGGRAGMFEGQFQLPASLVCERCVLQWKWNAGNSWGTDLDTGRSCVGCGKQEQFYGCADVSIVPNSDVDISGDGVTISGDHVSSVSHTTTTTRASSEHAPSDTDVTTNHAHNDEYDDESDTENNKKPTPCITDEDNNDFDNAVHTTKGPIADTECRTASTGAFKNFNLDQWCTYNCAMGFCPPTHCECGEPKKAKKVKICKTTSSGPFRVLNLDSWCEANCSLGFCPSTHCECEGDKKKPEAVKRCKTTDTGPHKTGNYDSWCESNCRLGNCPPAFCKCV